MQTDGSNLFIIYHPNNFSTSLVVNYLQLNHLVVNCNFIENLSKRHNFLMIA